MRAIGFLMRPCLAVGIFSAALTLLLAIAADAQEKDVAIDSATPAKIEKTQSEEKRAVDKETGADRSAASNRKSMSQQQQNSDGVVALDSEAESGSADNADNAEPNESGVDETAGADADGVDADGADADGADADGADADGDEAEEERFDIVLTLDSEKMKRIEKTGYLKASLPPKFYNRVDSVVLRHPNSFLGKRYELSESNDKRNKVLVVAIDASVLEHLEFQPVKIKIYDSNFQAILLSYQPQREMIEASAASTLDPTKDSPQVFLRLHNGKGLTGHIKNFQQISVKTDLGEIGLPLESFAGVGFSQEQPGETVMVFDNGDMISGTTQVKKMTLKTRWGDKMFRVKDIHSLTRSSETELVSPEESKGSRWSVRRRGSDLSAPQNN